MKNVCASKAPKPIYKLKWSDGQITLLVTKKILPINYIYTNNGKYSQIISLPNLSQGEQKYPRKKNSQI